MAQKTIAELQEIWQTNYTPTQQDYRDLFESVLHLVRDYLNYVHSEVNGSNLSIGMGALDSMIEGALYNIAYGTDALRQVTTGINNVGLGDTSGYGLTTGNGNTFLGHDTYASMCPTMIGTTALGGGSRPTGDYQLVSGGPTSPILNAYIGAGVGNANAKLWIGKLNLKALPRTAEGLEEGDVWNNAGVLTIVTALI